MSPPGLAQEVRTYGMYGDTSLCSAMHVAAVPPRGSTTRGQQVAQSLGTRRGAGGATGCTLWRWGWELEHPTWHCWWHPGVPAAPPPPLHPRGVFGTIRACHSQAKHFRRLSRAAHAGEAWKYPQGLQSQKNSCNENTERGQRRPSVRTQLLGGEWGALHPGMETSGCP